MPLMSNIKSITPVGAHQTYDLEVEHPDHQFFLANGMLTSNSHAVAYAIDSYWCAWLLRNYEESWLIAYLESMSGNPDSRAKAFGEVKGMGYQIVSIDVNHATDEWIALPGKRFMPSLLSCKGVGQAAIDELIEKRPYNSIDEFLWNDDGTWKHSKFNKRALEALVRIEALNSLDCVGPDKVFKNYKHMWVTLFGEHTELVKKRKNDDTLTEVTKDHSTLIKRSTKSDPFEGKRMMYELARRFADTPDFTPEERLKIYEEYFGSIDASLLVDNKKLAKLAEKGVRSVDEYDEPDIYWFAVVSCEMKMTKNKKTYALLRVMGTVGKEKRINVWGAKAPFQANNVYIAELEANDYGMSTTSWKVRPI